MPTVMMCGASDTRHFEPTFQHVAEGLGFSHRSFISGRLVHRNDSRSSFSENSVRSIDASDLAVIVVHEEFGATTWNLEFKRLLETNKPFKILINASVYTGYTEWQRITATEPQRAFRGPQIYMALEQAQLDEKTFITFNFQNFEECLRSAIQEMVREGLEAASELSREREERARLGSQLQRAHQQLAATGTRLDESSRTKDRMQRDLVAIQNRAGQVEKETEQVREALREAQQEVAILRTELDRNRRHVWRSVPLLALITLVLGIGLGAWIRGDHAASVLPAAGATSALASGRPPTSPAPVPGAPVGTPVDSRDDAGAAVEVVDQYFASIRDKSWNSLAALQSDRFRAKNPEREVIAFWKQNPLGLWAKPKVVSEKRDIVWVRVPFIIGPERKTSRLQYMYVYWGVLRGTPVIDRTAKGALCPTKDESTCPEVAPPG